MKKSKLTTGFLLLVCAELIYNISAYIIKFGTGHLLGPATYGRFTLVLGFTTMIIVLVGRGMTTAMNKRLSENSDNPGLIKGIRRSAGEIQLIIITTLTILFFLCAPLIAQIFNDPTLTNLFRLSALLIPTFALSSFHVAYFNGLKAFKAMTIMKISRGVFRGLLIILGAYLYGLTGALWGAIVAPLAVYLVALLIERYSLPQSSATMISYSKKELLNYAGVFMLFLLFYEFYVRTDIYMIKSLTGSDELTGLYDAAMTIALIPYYGLFALTFVLFPTVSDLVKHGHREKLRGILTKILVLLTLALTIACAILSLFAPQLVSMLYGEEFATAATLIPLMLGGTVFGTVFYVLASVFNGAGMTRIPASIVGFAIIITLTLNYIYIPLYGIIAPALVFSLTSTLMGLTSLVMLYYKFYK